MKTQVFQFDLSLFAQSFTALIFVLLFPLQHYQFLITSHAILSSSIVLLCLSYHRSVFEKPHFVDFGVIKIMPQLIQISQQRQKKFQSIGHRNVQCLSSSSNNTPSNQEVSFTYHNNSNSNNVQVFNSNSHNQLMFHRILLTRTDNQEQNWNRALR